MPSIPEAFFHTRRNRQRRHAVKHHGHGTPVHVAQDVAHFLRDHEAEDGARIMRVFL